MWRGCVFGCLIDSMLTGLLFLRVVHSDNSALNYRRQEHRQHLHSHSCRGRTDGQCGGTVCSKLWPRPGVRIWGVLCVGGLTVGCGRVSVSVIPPEEHVEGQIRNVVALLMEQRENTTLNDNTSGEIVVIFCFMQYNNRSHQKVKLKYGISSFLPLGKSGGSTYAHQGLEQAGHCKEPQHAASRRRPASGYKPQQQIRNDTKRSGKNQPVR